MLSINQILLNKQHVLWIFLQQFLVRILVGVKFLIIARILGPQSVGLISIALVTLAFIEAVTELGFMQAIVTKEKNLTLKQEHAIWTMQALRGILIFISLICCAGLIENLFNVTGAAKVILVMSLVPLLRNLVSVGIYKSQRNKNFKVIALLQVVTTIIDFILTYIFIVIFESALSAILAMVISEAVKTILSHFIFKNFPRINFNFKDIRDINNYGKWIWANSVSTLIFSQIDKVLASRYLGVTMLGFYQTSQKLSQMAIYDTSNPLGQYMFPLFSESYRQKKKSLNNLFFLSYSSVLNFAILTAAFLYLNADIVVSLILGQEWGEIISLFKLMIIAQCLAAIVNICIVYLRAIGKPKFVTINAYLQLTIVTILSLVSIGDYGAKGLIYASIIGYIFTNITLTLVCLKNLKNMFKKIIVEVIKICVVILILVLINLVVSNNIYYFISSIVVYVSYLIYFIIQLKGQISSTPVPHKERQHLFK